MKNYKNTIILIVSLLSIVLIATIIFLLANNQKLTDKNSVSVYFVKSYENAYFKITPIKRKLPRNSNNVKLLIAVKELLKGPSNKEKKGGFYTEIPSSTRLIGIKETPKEITINLSKDFESGGGSTSMSVRLKQFAYTVLDAEKNKPVYLELDGKRVDFIGGEGVIVTQPISR